MKREAEEKKCRKTERPNKAVSIVMSNCKELAYKTSI